jgi:hypothetical protein
MALTGVEEVLDEVPEEVEVWVVEPLEAAAFAAALAAAVVKAVIELAIENLPSLFKIQILKVCSVILQFRCQFTPCPMRRTLALLSRLILRCQIAV